MTKRKTPVIRHAYFKGETKQRNRPTIKTGKGLTETSHKDDCDLNLVMKRYVRTGVIPMFNQRNKEPRYEDVSMYGDFQSAMNKIAEGKRLFAELPENVRDYFDNDPNALMSATEEQLIEAGAINKPEETAEDIPAEPESEPEGEPVELSS